MASTLPIFLALDGMTEEQCLGLASKVKHRVAGYKIHDLWDNKGPDVVSKLAEKSEGAAMWVDLKLYDIPQTVALRAKAARKAGAGVLTVHTEGEIEMMMAAKENGPKIILGITALTSMSEEEIHLMMGQPSKAAVLYRARMAKLAGIDGVVCSPQEVGMLAKRTKWELKGMIFVTPGVRSPGKEAADQKRIDIPEAAILAGSTYLVVGREVTKAEDPLAALEAIALRIEPAMQERQKATTV